MKYIAPANLTLLEALSHLSPQSSKTTLRSWIKEGRVYIDQAPTKTATEIVLKGQLVTVSNRKKFLPQDIEVLYEDQDFVVIDKPNNLLSVAAAFENEETAHGILKNYYRPRKVFIVHRLDQDTSGVMLFALNQHAHEKLKEIFENHDIQRSYTAIVEGQMESLSGTWKNYLYEDDQYFVHTTEDPERGREAITHYKTLATSKKYSWLNLTLETGRKNQIRVHCQKAGHPVVGDKKYGGHASPIKRLCLHAHLLAFIHPITKKKLRFESPIPEEFYRLLKLPAKS
jgi:23S rRNA pseudouridine1911/1915/1917 synthase